MGLETRRKARGATGWEIGRWRLKKVQAVARSELPREWLGPIDLQARAAHGGLRWYADTAAREVWEQWLRDYGGAAAADMSDAAIKARALECANEAESLDMGYLAAPGVLGLTRELWRMQDFCEARGVDAPVQFGVKGMFARVRCRYWWRRALRRMVARRCERGALHLGLVSKPSGQPYCSNKSVWRRVDQNKRNRDALEHSLLENEEGYRRTLAELSATSVSNKAIRRGELMTRIRGCEEIADAMGHRGLFVTLTCPSRFHSTKRNGKRNKKHDGSTPKDAQQWLCLQWARARAELKREGVSIYGFRVAEPHHDGCTHWHALLWAGSELAMHQAAAIIGKAWLAHEGREEGAKDYRVNVKVMEKGGAAGYVAKYISKNIDDHGIDSHLDDYAEGEIGPDLLGDMEIKPCMRVEAWAATWGIRQFQPIGQPPVTVWRELRRVSEKNARAAGLQSVIFKAWQAAQKTMGVLASWARYVSAQGGVMMGRRYMVKAATELREVPGLYGAQARPCIVGVSVNLPGARCVFSERQLWRAVEVGGAAEVGAGVGSSSARSAPRTRVNNCTHNQKRTGPLVEYQAERMASEIDHGHIARMAAMIRAFDARRAGVG